SISHRSSFAGFSSLGLSAFSWITLQTCTLYVGCQRKKLRKIFASEIWPLKFLIRYSFSARFSKSVMRNLLVGIDSGTQSTKVLVVDSRDGKVLASASQAYDLIPDLPPGAKEQHPHTWREATASAIRQGLRQAKAVAADVVAIGVSGQQHGFVPLDDQGEVIRP